MKLPIQVAAVVRHVGAGQRRWPSAYGVRRSAGLVAQGEDCPPGSGNPCPGNEKCCFNSVTKRYSCAVSC